MKRLCLILLLLANSILSAQSPIVENISTEQGLSQRFVTEIAQDREGYLWFGTLNTGLNRFDGYRFKQFANNPFNANSLSGNNIYDIAELGDYLFIGTLWNGINLFHKKTERFFRLPFYESDQTFPAANTHKDLPLNILPAPAGFFIAKENDGTLWVRVHKHPNDASWICRIRFPSGFWERLPVESPEKQKNLLQRIQIDYWSVQNYVAGTFEDGKTIFRAFKNQLLYWNKDNWQVLPAPSVISEQEGMHIPGLYSDKEKYWRTTNGEIWRSLEKGKKWEKVAVAPPGKNILYLHRQYVVCKTANDIEAFPVRYSPFAIDFSRRLWHTANSDARYTRLVDKSGIFWFVNGIKGVMKINPGTIAFNYIPTENSTFHRPFLTTDKGVLSYYIDSARRICITGQPEADAAFVQSAFIADSMRLGIIRSDGRRRVWIGGRQYLALADLGKRIAKSYRLPYHSRHAPNEFLPQKDGWVLLPVGGALIHLNSIVDTAFSLDFRHAGLGWLQIYSIEKSADGSIWLATDDGLLRILPGKGKWLRTDKMSVSGAPGFKPVQVYQAIIRLYKTNENDPHSLRNNTIACLLNDPLDPNILWVGSKGGGLNRLDIKADKFTHLTTANGLPDDVVYGILPDKANNLWLSTNKGLVCYRPQTGAIKSYRKADGLQDDEFNTSAYAKDDNGIFYFGGINGMNVFDPAAIRLNSLKPRVQLTGLKINGKNIDTSDSTHWLNESIGFCKKLKLPFFQNNITLEFAALEFTASSKNQYRYWLQGLEEEEDAHISTEPSANYLALPPGRYTFVVYGANNDGVWSDQPATIQIVIRPPWYRHWLSYLAYTTLVAGLLLWYWNQWKNKRKLEYQLALERKEYEMQAEIHRLKLEEITQRLLEKSQLLEELETNKPATPPNIHPPFHNIRLLTQEDWNSFQERFEQVYPGYIQKLAHTFDHLTPSEIRLILLMKLRLSTAESASMLGVLPESIKKTRHRLRKKLESKHLSLEDLLF